MVIWSFTRFIIQYLGMPPPVVSQTYNSGDGSNNAQQWAQYQQQYQQYYQQYQQVEQRYQIFIAV